ncbi:MAG: hypothetical protein R3C30_02565 [Hyphomonadaceae bacterium]
MRNFALQTLADQLAADGELSADDALQMRRAVFPDGVVSREEAEMFIALAARVANSDEAWTQAFVEAISDHVLAAGAYPGHVDEATVSWLMAHFGPAGPRETEVETLLKLQERAESAPESLCEFTRQRVAALLAGRPVGAAETELVRRCLYASSGSGRTSVTETEARWMFALDAESNGRVNDPAWGDLFVKAVLCHLMGRRAPEVLEANAMLARQAWLNAPTLGVRASLASIFKGGVSAYKNKVREAGVVERLEGHYEVANFDAESDAELTLSEIAWTVGMTREDGQLTANEQALLAEIRKIEAGETA